MPSLEQQHREVNRLFSRIKSEKSPPERIEGWLKQPDPTNVHQNSIVSWPYRRELILIAAHYYGYPVKMHQASDNDTFVWKGPVGFFRTMSAIINDIDNYARIMGGGARVRNYISECIRIAMSEEMKEDSKNESDPMVALRRRSMARNVDFLNDPFSNESKRNYGNNEGNETFEGEFDDLNDPKLKAQEEQRQKELKEEQEKLEAQKKQEEELQRKRDAKRIERENAMYDPTKKVRHECFSHVLNLAMVGQNILLCGPSGSGKTYLAAEIAKEMELPFGSQSCSAGMTEGQLAGWLLPIGDGGRFTYVPSLYVHIYENGGVFLLDEVDAADENTLIFINGSIAGTSFHLPQRFDNPIVKRHDDFVVIAAANTFGLGESVTYSGRNRLDGATLDRFRAGMVIMDYCEEMERTIVDPDVYRWGLPIREHIEENNLDRIMSTRVLLDFTNQKQELNYQEKEWAKSYFADWSVDEMESYKNALQEKQRGRNQGDTKHILYGRAKTF